MTVTLDQAKFSAVHYAETTSALRSAEVAAENKRTPWGRETIFGLMSSAMTVGDMTAALLATMKPKKPNGKAGDTLSSLRYAKGGDAIRKAADLCVAIVEAANTGQIAEAFRPIVIAFACDAPDAPKTLYALRDEMSRLRREAAKAAQPEGEAEGDADGDANAKPEVTPLAVMADRLAVYLAEASVEAIAEADESLSALMEALRNAANRVDDATSERTGTEG